MPTIVTLTPNPSIDLLFETTRLVWDDANRVESPRRRAGGQGVNVVRAVRELGGESLAIVPLGGASGRELRELLEAEGTPLREVPIAGETRVFCGVRETETDRSMLINPRGPVLSRDEGERLLAETARVLDELTTSWLACCGSVTRGLEPDFYARAGAVARARGVSFVPDGDGEALRLAAAAGCELLVPNEHEAARLLDCAPLEPRETAAAARALRRWAPLACITLGARGAVCASAAGTWQAVPPPRPAGSAVGAGDVFLAAFLLALEGGAEPADALRRPRRPCWEAGERLWFPRPTSRRWS
ncbi:MAG TPA: PfkB family carbohydrate kinase, partial [Longimicrobiales bacterium]